jgi:methylglyoxal synthase
MSNNIRALAATKRIALVAHDHRKSSLVAWARRHRSELERHELMATGTTGKLIEEALQLPVRRFMSGPLGGDQQIGSRIAQGLIDMLIFFWDPMHAQPHDTDVRALLRIAVTWNIPLACDEATADFIISSPFMNTGYDALIDDYGAYTDRQI